MITRIIHFFFMFVFILFMLIHVYLANVEGISPTKMMFAWKEHGGLVYDPKLHNIVGEDEGEKH
jgi:Ni/Fe-hydrogenase 1 B-type cytochrome subunit